MNTKLCVYLGEALSEYHFGTAHPFGPLRYDAFYKEFKKRGLEELVIIHTPVLATEQEIALFHSESYIEQVRRQSQQGKGFLDYGDTPARKGIYEAATTVVGTVLKAVDGIMNGHCISAFVPIAGLHHARRDAAAGFCVFNDCAVAIEALQKIYGLTRIAYVDIDAHHGDGVFYAFEENANICIVDLHEDGHFLYPGSGFAEESGKYEALGTKLNIPLPPDCKDDIALAAWEKAEAFVRDAEPEFIILQCGADSLAGDPITDMHLSAAFHGHVAIRLTLLAGDLGHGRLLALGGGGYDLKNIATAWTAVVEGMLSN
ncbi:MAG: acetoin utilization protein AcuC [Gammaproteobacteria bacterium]|nr:acetoin utilization protein AcuC [Gammaproteobacteria bacterium]